MNTWYENGWKNKLYWKWVSQIGKKDKNGSVQMQEPVITGFWVDGEKFEKAKDVFNRVLKE